jgi:hypothetical protein
MTARLDDPPKIPGFTGLYRQKAATFPKGG